MAPFAIATRFGVTAKWWCVVSGWVDTEAMGLVQMALTGSAERLDEARSVLIGQASVIDLRGGGDPTFAGAQVDERLAGVLSELALVAAEFEEEAALIAGVVRDASAADDPGLFGLTPDPIGMLVGPELLDMHRDRYRQSRALAELAKQAFPILWNQAVDESIPPLGRQVLDVAAKANAVWELRENAVELGEEVAWQLTGYPWKWDGPPPDEPDPPNGDLGGTYSSRDIVGFPGAQADSPTQRGRAALAYLISETHHESQFPAGPRQIQDDEFEVIKHDHDTYTVVLPGVIDLSDPIDGLHPLHQSVRSLYYYALASMPTTNKNDNKYAVMVEEALDSRGVPRGAELMIVGHSFGSDTALDLAADPVFNGKRYDVTHVLAAGYYNQEQLEHVQPGTDVLALQNEKDLPVMFESLRDRATFDSPTRHDHDADLIQFPGGSEGFGHHPGNYAGYIAETDDPTMLAFFESVDAAGYTTPGHAQAIDISVPLDQE